MECLRCYGKVGTLWNASENMKPGQSFWEAVDTSFRQHLDNKHVIWKFLLAYDKKNPTKLKIDSQAGI